MSLLNVSRLSFRYPSTIELFQDATFAIEPGDRLAIVGPNGAGKSTLLSILAGELDPTGGAVARRKDLRVAVADQQGAVTGSLFDHVFGARPRLAALRARLAGTEHDSPCEYAELVNEFDAAGGYAAEARTESILTGLGFAPCEWHLPAAKLSGGQRTRAGLARALHTDADLLLLDEPTNHLDIAAREWLEEQLDGGRGACVLVSHDRTLLRHVATRVLEIERGQVTLFEGGYDAYRAKRALTERQAWQDYDASQRRKAAAEQASERRSRLAVQVATAPPGVRTSRDFYARKAAKVARTARLLRERAERGRKPPSPGSNSRSPGSNSRASGGVATLRWPSRIWRNPTPASRSSRESPSTLRAAHDWRSPARTVRARRPSCACSSGWNRPTEERSASAPTSRPATTHRMPRIWTAQRRLSQSAVPARWRARCWPV